MKAGKSSATAMVLPQLLDELAAGVERRVVGGDAADQLDQLHHRHRIHEVNADELLRPVGRGGEPRDRDRRGVGADDRVGLQVRAEVGENLALDLFLLGRRLDDEIAVAELVERVGRRDARERGLAVLLGDQLARDLPRQIAVDGGEPGIDAVGRDVVEQHVHAGERGHMRDAVTHLTGADHADLADCEAMFSAWPLAAAPWPLPHLRHRCHMAFLRRSAPLLLPGSTPITARASQARSASSGSA